VENAKPGSHALQERQHVVADKSFFEFVKQTIKNENENENELIQSY
jgi:hypothetical protein